LEQVLGRLALTFAMGSRPRFCFPDLTGQSLEVCIRVTQTIGKFSSYDVAILGTGYAGS
jgi:hypothetical protein